MCKLEKENKIVSIKNAIKVFETNAKMPFHGCIKKNQ